MRILTVGDGDLTLSLALARCYGSQIKLTATTLCSSYQELCDTYSNSADVIQELTRQRQATVLYGVDATKLSQNPELVAASVFDLIVFHHPHLGLMTSNDSASDEQFQAQRHFVLLAHYLASAKALLLLQCREHVPATTVNHDNHYNPMIHLCITHHQAQTWEMKRAAQRNGLRLVQTAKTNAPFHAIINPLFYTTTTKLTNLPKEPGFAAPRRYRNGKLGSHHYLAGYGYMHRRTHGEKHAGKADMNVEGSKHYFFVANDDDNQPQNDTGKAESGESSIFSCDICGLTCESKDALNNHLEAPALPDPPAMDINEKKRPPPTTEHGSNNNFGARDTTATVSNNEDQIVADSNNSWHVTKEHSGKRLRRFLQHVAFPKRARKKCDKLVTEGQILVNGSVAKDTSRILTSGDVVSTNEKDVTFKLQAIHASLQPDLPMLAAWDGPKHSNPGSSDDGRSCNTNTNALVVVVNKPVGMRAKGIYESARTMEQIVSDQLEARYHSLSSVDTGIGGLCVLQRQPVGGKKKIDNQDFVELDNIRLESKFTALVHGHVPSEWDDPGIQVAVPIRSIRKWGQQREELQDDESDPASTMIEEDNDDDEDQGVDDDNTEWAMKIVCTERTLTRGRSQDDEPAPALCTLQISTTCQASGLCRAIILYLRKQRYPVVGDRLCQRELGQLPRSMRNRIKKKLLMGCFGVQLSATVSSSTSIDKKIGEPTSTNVSVVVEDDKTRSSVVDCQVDIPERYSANFWQSHWENATTLDPNASTS